jgi:hypothetical protein
LSSRAQNVQPGRAVGFEGVVVVVGVVEDVGVVVVVLAVVVVAVVVGAVVVGAVVVVVVETALTSHHLTVPWRGSPKVVLLQSTPPVNVRGLVNVPFAP